MTTLREAATQALGALEGGADSWQLVGPAIDALKEALVEDAMQKFTDVNQELEAALAEPVQEPVAWMVYTEGGTSAYVTDNPNDLVGAYRALPLYTSPPQRPAEPVQEQPVCDECGKHKRDGWALYCVKCVEPMFAPPQRPAESVQEPQCNPHPKAPHGFLRNASHNENRYVCECEGWEPYEAGYQAGMEAALRAQS